MNRMLAIAAIIVAIGPLAVGQTKSARRTQTEIIMDGIRRLDQERIQAQIHADAAALDRIYADDFIGIGPSGTVRTKPQVLVDFTSHDLNFQSITTDEVRIRVYGNTAVETGRSTMVGQDKGKVVPRDNRFTRVCIRREGRWRLVANHYSLSSHHENKAPNKSFSYQALWCLVLYERASPAICDAEARRRVT